MELAHSSILLTMRPRNVPEGIVAQQENDIAIGQMAPHLLIKQSPSKLNLTVPSGSDGILPVSPAGGHAAQTPMAKNR